ncbi:F-box protein [Forsythia ovata]|uniref:F-box protein n=1 Tax=Forsythia ovata TaxID=205694 RepID=A0ABD1UTD8_9LAMI
MFPDLCGSSFLLALPDDIFVIVSRSLSPRDVINLGLCCRGLHSVVASDKVWFAQCAKLGLVPYKDLIEWRRGVCSYKAALQVPSEYSAVAGDLGSPKPRAWQCSLCYAWFLIDRWVPDYPSRVDRTCNVLLLEAEPRHQRNGGKLIHSKSFAHLVEKEESRKISRPDSEISKSQRMAGQKGKVVPFSRLGFGDRRRLLDIITSQVRLQVPDASNVLLFPPSRTDEVDLHKDLAFLCERRLLLLQMYKGGSGHNDLKTESPLDPTQLGSSEVRKSLDYTTGYLTSQTGDGTQVHSMKKTISGFFKDGIKQILGKSSSTNGTNCESKHAQLHEFLRSGDTIGLTLRATTMKLSSYRAWPNMHDNRFAIYKLPIQVPRSGHQYAGLWGGTFGWPPGRPSEDKPGKALFFLLLSYEESEGQQLLIATKILEAQPSSEIFPWDTDGDSNPLYVNWAFMGEGIANGYGFRYPGSKPGSLFVIHDGLLAFIWKESRAVLTLQRLNLQELLKKGEQVPSLSPVPNFSYLTKTYSNVFSGLSNSSNDLSLPR